MSNYDGPPLDELSRALAEGRHSRLTLVKVGAAALLATAFPALAHGQTRSPCRRRCVGNPCGVDPALPCGSSAQTGNCLCAQQTNGRCECFQPVCGVGPECGDTSTGGGGTCPPGFACVNDDCCGVAFCAALCGTPLDAQAATYTRWG